MLSDTSKKLRGIESEKSYLYKGRNEKCKFSWKNVAAKVSGYTSIAQFSEKELTQAIATVGPVSVAIDASQFSMQFYSGGLYYEPRCSRTYLDHGVRAVGYESKSKGKDFYIVRNSWALTVEALNQLKLHFSTSEH
jgi:cathepsin L